MVLLDVAYPPNKTLINASFNEKNGIAENDNPIFNPALSSIEELKQLPQS